MAMAAAWALTWPVAAQAGPKRVGILMSTADTDPRERQSIRIFLQTLTDLGWDEGRNIEFSYGWGAGDAQRMEAKARAMVALNPDVLLVKGGALPATREATSTIPIVFVITNASGIQQFAPNFARPGGNATGFTSSEITMAGKRLQLLHEMSPGIARALYITNPLIGVGTTDISERVKQDARTMGVSLTEAAVNSVSEINAVVERFVREGGGGGWSWPSTPSLPCTGARLSRSPTATVSQPSTRCGYLPMKAGSFPMVSTRTTSSGAAPPM